MSLATRCSACGTVFRVVQDQLKVSEGWVRCGRCNEIFNALEGLFDLDRDSTPDSWAPTVPDPGDFGPSTRDTLGAAFSEGGAEAPDDPALVDRIDEHLFGPRRSHVAHRKPLADVDERDQLEFADARLDSEPLSDSPPIDLMLDDPAADPAALALESEQGATPETPEFMQRAERAARWQRPRVRLALGVAALVLLAGLGLQMAHQQRDALAARWPELLPLLEAACEPIGCRIEPLRRIEDISVESTALTRISGPADAFKLTVALRNRGGLPLALPSIDLSLTDATGQLVARRALAPRDFQVVLPSFEPGSESTWQLTLAAGSPRVAGYTVEIFYP
jgi:predicted Zn finger-like uncharacterized protein